VGVEEKKPPVERWSWWWAEAPCGARAQLCTMPPKKKSSKKKGAKKGKKKAGGKASATGACACKPHIYKRDGPHLQRVLVFAWWRLAASSRTDCPMISPSQHLIVRCMVDSHDNVDA
jgi:hypothetical protein